MEPQTSCGDFAYVVAGKPNLMCCGEGSEGKFSDRENQRGKASVPAVVGNAAILGLVRL